MVRVKICGITNLEDALQAVESGADVLGFIMFKGSKRYISPKEVRNITKNLPPFIAKVGVFVNEDRASVLEILSYAGLDFAQLHGDETVNYCKYIGKERVIKVFRLKSENEIAKIKEFETVSKAILLDTYSEKSYGGTGKSFDWKIAVKVKESISIPLILSGGLNLNNVKEAIKTVEPFAVDVCSGVEEEPGRKNHNLVRDFIRAVKCNSC
ncbi:phosphoribosylanthranilate isomerase [Desulfurobacterium atlanticum]|uniref:N-(5'-phosphoribosyl)anthranilate isomerase n=1 Tax=Desulfurobacterium atlanticum TaxID=240169 RepID=A0A238Z3U4_9BACT|nr:phosphoribosylanthranilate isomerase [Desulfurobacterium atlanticum]SNR77524.1 phosphoribosylanthranilate isomerase [Desulfurobacterium atlanticum]